MPQKYTFSSFLAGMLLLNPVVDDVELCMLMSRFQNDYCVDIEDDDQDKNMNMLEKVIACEGEKIFLRRKYTDLIVINDKKITVRSFLLSSTTNEILSFLTSGIPSDYCNFVKRGRHLTNI